MNILVGLIGIAFGFLIVWKAEWIYQNFGEINWAERHLATEGGTRIMWKLIGILVIIIFMLIMFDFMGGIIRSIFNSIFPQQNV